jgi:3-deoxy-7-phosphoheptulonate synthase
MNYQTDDLRINEIKTVTPPAVLLEEIPVTDQASKTTYDTRQAIHNILSGNDDRLVVIIGPCSIHDIESAKEYASRLKPLIAKYSDDLLIIMRVYFEKPRTTVGWKGLINDPNLNGSFEINQGLRLARGLLHDLNESGVPAATEFLDVITPQYVSDLISWGAIGARTTESQIHRELASGLSCPVGFKNGTDGTTRVAVDAIGAAIRPHHFLSLRKEGNSGIFSTTGNPDCHIILRGGKTPNYDTASINRVAAELENAGLSNYVMVDFSHANSNKKYELQMKVGTDVANQIAAGDKRIIGVMIESHLVAGRQDIVEGQELTYGQSITDACLGWDDSATLIEKLAQAVQKRRS